MEDDDEILPEYDIKKMKNLTRGKYAARYRESFQLFRLADDVAAYFNDEDAVNEALREYMRQHPIKDAS